MPLKRPELINRELGVSFSDMEIEKIVEDVKYALALKFVVHRPSIELLRQHIFTLWGFLKKPNVLCSMYNKHVLLQLMLKRDYMHSWAREGRMVVGYSFRLFNW